MVRDLRKNLKSLEDNIIKCMDQKEIAEYNGIRLPNSLKLDFNEPEYPKTMQDQISYNTYRLQNNLITQPKLMMEENDDLTLEEATAIVEQNKAINQGDVENNETQNRE